MRLRSLLYKLARALGDANAVSRGPEHVVKRVVRRTAGRLTSRLLWRILR